MYESTTSPALVETPVWTLSGASAKFIVEGDSTMQQVSGVASSFNVDGGTIEARGNVIVGTGAGGGTTNVKVNGTGSQTYRSTGGSLPSVEVDKTAIAPRRLEGASPARRVGVAKWFDEGE